LIDSGDDKEVGNNSERLDDGRITWWDFVNGRDGNGWEEREGIRFSSAAQAERYTFERSR
jgi:hypothetical protein